MRSPRERDPQSYTSGTNKRVAHFERNASWEFWGLRKGQAGLQSSVCNGACEAYEGPPRARDRSSTPRRGTNERTESACREQCRRTETQRYQSAMRYATKDFDVRKLETSPAPELLLEDCDGIFEVKKNNA